MAYSALPSKTTGDTITLTNWNAIKANFEAGVPDIFQTKGDIAAATAANTAARLAIGNDDDILVPDSTQSAGLAWQIQPACRVYDSSDQTISATTWTTVTFDSERYDTDTLHSTTTNTGRITIPTDGAGLYSIGCNIQAGACGTMRVRILLNGTTTIAQQSHYYDSGSSPTNMEFNLFTEYSLSVTDYLEVQVYFSSAVDVKAAGNMSPEFWVRWERRA